MSKIVQPPVSLRLKASNTRQAELYNSCCQQLTHVNMLRRKRTSGQQPAAVEAQKHTKASKSDGIDLETAVLGFQDNALNVVLGQVAK